MYGASRPSPHAVRAASRAARRPANCRLEPAAALALSPDANRPCVACCAETAWVRSVRDCWFCWRVAAAAGAGFGRFAAAKWRWTRDSAWVIWFAHSADVARSDLRPAMEARRVGWRGLNARQERRSVATGVPEPRSVAPRGVRRDGP